MGPDKHYEAFSCREGFVSNLPSTPTNTGREGVEY